MALARGLIARGLDVEDDPDRLDPSGGRLDGHRVPEGAPAVRVLGFDRQAADRTTLTIAAIAASFATTRLVSRIASRPRSMTASAVSPESTSKSPRFWLTSSSSPSL